MSDESITQPNSHNTEPAAVLERFKKLGEEIATVADQVFLELDVINEEPYSPERLEYAQRANDIAENILATTNAAMKGIFEAVSYVPTRLTPVQEAAAAQKS